MAVKLSALTTESAPDSADIIGIADPTTGVMKKITVSALKTYMDTLGGGTAPTVSSATCPNGAANTVVVVFSQSMTAVTTAGWSFKKNGSAWSVSSVTGSGTTWTFTMGSSAISTDTLLRSYDSTTGATIGTTLELVSFTDQSVTNSVSASYLHRSLFTAANGTTLAAYTPDNGTNFSALSGTMDIQNNALSPLTFASTASGATLDVGQNTYTMEVIAKLNDTSKQIRIFFKKVDANNQYWIGWTGNNVQLNSLVGGGFSSIRTDNPSPSISDTSFHTFLITVAATTVSLSIDGNVIFTGQSIDAACQAGENVCVDVVDASSTANCAEITSITITA